MFTLTSHENNKAPFVELSKGVKSGYVKASLKIAKKWSARVRNTMNSAAVLNWPPLPSLSSRGGEGDGSRVGVPRAALVPRWPRAGMSSSFQDFGLERGTCG